MLSKIVSLVKIRRTFEARDRRHGGDEPVAMTKRRALMRWSPATTVVLVDEAAGGLDHLHAEAGEALDRVVGRDGGDDALDVVVHAPVVDRRLHRHDAERAATCAWSARACRRRSAPWTARSRS